jgi:putative AlgH/UPF0301 family transcriptional regulator
MQIRAGSLLLAHPAHGEFNRSQQVVYVTESNTVNTLGLILNNRISNMDLRQIMLEKGNDWRSDSTVYRGGDINPTALVMLHSDEWYSSNTMQVDGLFSISSDRTMVDKLEMGNTPDWYRLFVGMSAWQAEDLEFELKSKKPRWLLLTRPSQALIELADGNLWQNAVSEYSQDVFADYI